MRSTKVKAKRGPGQLTVRGISDEMQTYLRQEATRQGLSVNQTVLDLLGRASGLDNRVFEHQELDHLFGQWSEAEAACFDRHVEEIRQVDEELWP
jgi:hypothetical protein